MGSSLVIGILVSLSGLAEASSILGCYVMLPFNRLQYNTLVSGKLCVCVCGEGDSCDCGNELSACIKCWDFLFLTT